MAEQTQHGYDEAVKAIEEGKATPHALWILLSAESDRDRYALKPKPWEGSGEYQHVDFNGDHRLVRIPTAAGCSWKRTLIAIHERATKTEAQHG